MTPPSQGARLREMIWDHVQETSLTDIFTAVDLCGPGLVIAGNPPTPGMGWSIGLSIKSSLMGYDDIMGLISFHGELPPERVVKEVASKLMEACRNGRDEQATMPATTPSGDLPAGLQGAV